MNIVELPPKFETMRSWKMKELMLQENNFFQPSEMHRLEIFDVLFLKLSTKGSSPVEIIRLVKDSFAVIRNGGELSATSMNQKFERQEPVFRHQ